MPEYTRIQSLGKFRWQNRCGRARLANAIALVERGTQVVDGRVSFRQAASIEDPAVLFRLFELVARHNVRLTAETENAVAATLPGIQKWVATTSNLWITCVKSWCCLMPRPHCAR